MCVNSDIVDTLVSKGDSFNFCKVEAARVLQGGTPTDSSRSPMECVQRKTGHNALIVKDKSLEVIEGQVWDWNKDGIVEIDARGSQLKQLPELPPLHRAAGARPTRDKKGNLVYKFYETNHDYPWDTMICVKSLNISETPIETLPHLPHGLECLYAWNCPNLTQLPPLPKTLKELHVGGTPLKTLPTLPEGLGYLDVGGCPIRFLPRLPKSLSYLCVDDCDKLFLRRTVTEIPATDEALHGWHDMLRFVDGDEDPVLEIWEPIEQYKERSNTLWNAMNKTRRIKESLVAKVFHPSRVAKWLEIGDYELLEMMF